MPADRVADARIAAKIRARDFDHEVEAWVRLFQKKALAMARHWGHGPEAAEDFVQCFWVALFRSELKSYDADQSLFTYCFAIFRHEFFRTGAPAARERQTTDSIETTTG